ncbi:MAG: hypothetical protein AAGA48_14325 [Myxococcota bacterium]
MIGWIVQLAGLTFATEPPGELSSPWLVGRWRVASETIDPNAPLALIADRRELLARAWQVEAILDCRADVASTDRVECRVEDVALRVATYDHWQRASDRDLVDALLAQVRTRILATPIPLFDPGDGRIASDIKNPRSVPGAAVLSKVFAGFYLEEPPEGWQSGARWRTASDPLLNVSVVHDEDASRIVRHSVRGESEGATVWTEGSAKKKILSVPRDPLELRSTTWRKPRASRNAVLAMFKAPNPPSTAAFGFGLPGRVKMRSQSTVDLNAGTLLDRRWVATGTGAAEMEVNGRIRRIADDAEVTLGSTEQISAPEAPRPGLPEWASILGVSP